MADELPSWVKVEHTPRKLPIGRPFQKGNRANQNPGVRKTAFDLAKLCRTYTQEAIEDIVDMARDNRLKAETRLKAWQEILDRGHGRASQFLAITSQAQQEVRVIHQQLEPVQWEERWSAARLQATMQPIIEMRPQESPVESAAPEMTAASDPPNE